MNADPNPIETEVIEVTDIGKPQIVCVNQYKVVETRWQNSDICFTQLVIIDNRQLPERQMCTSMESVPLDTQLTTKRKLDL